MAFKCCRPKKLEITDGYKLPSGNNNMDTHVMITARDKHGGAVPEGRYTSPTSNQLDRGKSSLFLLFFLFKPLSVNIRIL